MGDAKRLIVKPISARDACKIVKSIHYSGKVDPRSQLHLGVFLDGKCGGAMQFGPSLQKSSMIGLVRDTGWNEFIELNRMAFADWLPRNGESRAIGFAFRWIRKQYPHIKWCVSFADGTQCGDGTIYRASGFVLTAIKQNSSMWLLKSGEVICDVVTRMKGSNGVRDRIGFTVGQKWSSYAKQNGAIKLPGFQLRYIYFLDPTARERLTVPILPFSEIDRRGAGMYKGKPRVRSVDSDTTANHAVEGGATPTRTL
jgi:hypothetical protein